MSLKSIAGAWRALSTCKQADIATAVAVDTEVPLFGDFIEPEPNELYENTDEVGSMAPTAHRLLTMKIAAKHTSKAFPHLVGLLCSQAMGGATAAQLAQTTVYTHKLVCDKTVIELPYRTLVEYDGDAQKKYAGIAVSGFTIKGKRGGFVELEADLIGRGTEAADATAKPSRSEESYLTYADCGYNVGGAFAADAVTGATDTKARLQEFELTFKNNAKGEYPMGDSSMGYGRIQRGEKWEVGLKVKLEIDARTERTALLAGTDGVFQIPLVGGLAADPNHYKVDVVLPKAFYRSVKKSKGDGVLVVDAEMRGEDDGTNGPLLIYVTNLHATSYLAAAA